LTAVAPERIDPAHELGVQSEPGTEGKTPTVHAPERDPPRGRVSREQAGGLARIPGQPERPGQDARAPPRDETHRDVRREPVDHLVVAAVAGEDVEPFELPAELLGELPGLERPLREHRVDL